MNGQTSVDELWAELDASTGRQRCETLLALADRLIDRDHGQARSLAETAIEEALTLGDRRLAAEGHMLRGRLSYIEEDYPSSAQSYLAAANLAEADLDGEHAGRALQLAADALAITGDLETATALAERAETAYVATDHETGAANAALTLGKLLWRRDLNTAALAALDRARAGFRRLQIPTGVLDADDYSASALLDEGRADDAVQILEASLHVAPTVEGWSLPYTQRRLARALRLAGRPGDALPLLDDALANLVDSHAVLDVARTHFEQALACRDLGRSDEGLLALARARAHFDLAGADDMVTTCDTSHATWLHALGRLGEAADVNSRLTRHPDPAVRYSAVSRLADNHREAGDDATCLEVLERSDEPPPHPDAALWRESVRARALLAEGRPDDARACADRALGAAPSGASPSVLAPLYEVLAETTGADDVRVHAVALHLAAGDAEAAARLAHPLLPESTPAAE